MDQISRKNYNYEEMSYNLTRRASTGSTATFSAIHGSSPFTRRYCDCVVLLLHWRVIVGAACAHVKYVRYRCARGLGARS